MRALTLMIGSGALWVALVASSVPDVQAQAPPPARPRAVVPQMFEAADRCQACHNGLTTPSGEDVSIGVDWRASMMAHSARDPYWQAAVRREVLDHPAAAAAIENECSRCHMPMAHVTQTALGGSGQVFANLPAPGVATPIQTLAADGVSCTVCHQIMRDKLGSPESFTGHFVIDTVTPADQRTVFGPFADRPGPAEPDALGDDVPTGRERARPVVGAVRDLPHAVHAHAGRGRPGRRHAA